MIKAAARRIAEKFFPGYLRERAFTRVYNQWTWRNQSESRSGCGSTLEVTLPTRQFIEEVIGDYKIKSIVDAPCGDFNWFAAVRLPPDVTYLGCDIVREMVEHLQKKYGGGQHQFRHLDVVSRTIPQADLIVSREFFRHISLNNILAVLKNFKASGSRYLIANTNPEISENFNTPNPIIGSRPVNLERQPFNLPAPLKSIREYCLPEVDAREGPKCLALWPLKDIRF